MTGDLTARLAPPLALDYLRELSAGLEAAIVLGADGALLAGDAQLAAPAGRLLAAAPGDAPVARERAGDGSWLLAARRADGVAVAARAGAQALVALLEHDLRVVLAALEPADVA